MKSIVLTACVLFASIYMEASAKPRGIRPPAPETQQVKSETLAEIGDALLVEMNKLQGEKKIRSIVVKGKVYPKIRRGLSSKYRVPFELHVDGKKKVSFVVEANRNSSLFTDEITFDEPISVEQAKSVAFVLAEDTPVEIHQIELLQ